MRNAFRSEGLSAVLMNTNRLCYRHQPVLELNIKTFWQTGIRLRSLDWTSHLLKVFRCIQSWVQTNGTTYSVPLSIPDRAALLRARKKSNRYALNMNKSPRMKKSASVSTSFDTRINPSKTSVQFAYHINENQRIVKKLYRSTMDLTSLKVSWISYRTTILSWNEEKP